MGNTVLEVEGLSKLYRIGQIGTGALSSDLNVWWHGLRGKPNPYLKVGETNQRDIAGDSKYVWALKDINFSLQEGQVLGIIGNNGAGKSTLLKIISQITAPTSGSVRIKGKISSLLEVGIGFHPELSGRENIFLNGTIMGMTQREIHSQLDEIIDFAGIERYLDTPVKRYSSGMYVRLAFAVAAHLSPDILIVDEVLAVGDAAFQKKCMGKLNEIASRQGRTILFVSHNLGALSSLCKQGLVMSNGTMSYFGSINEAVDRYLNETVTAKKHVYEVQNIPDTPAYIQSAQLVSESAQEGLFDVHQAVTLQLKMVVREPVQGITPYFDLRYKGEVLYRTFASDLDESIMDELQPGVYDCTIPLLSPLKKGAYSLDIRILKLSTEFYDEVNNALSFEVDELNDDLMLKSYWHKRPGILALNQAWDIKRSALLSSN